jgi:trimeric autotransporter adhesin
MCWTAAPGGGTDVVADGDASVTGVDTLRIGGAVLPGSLVYVRNGNDLQIRSGVAADQILVAGHFTGTGVERLAFGDGTVWNASDITAHLTNELTEGADVFTGTAGADIIAARGGNDQVSGLGGNDAIDGGAGNDSLFGGDGNDTLVGGAGVDALNGDAGDDVLDGRSDAALDDMRGGAGADVYLFGRGSGSDWINDTGADGGVDVLRLDAGIAPGDIKLTSGGGYGMLLSINGSADSVTFSPPSASSNRLERIEFADGTVWTEAQWLQRMLSDSATPGNDTIVGFASNDVINGLDGNDYLASLGGNDTLDGGAGADTLYGGDGNDTLIDGETMFGEAGSDTYVLRSWQATTITEVAETGVTIDTLVLPVTSASISVLLGYNSTTSSYDDLYLQSAGAAGYVVVPKFFNTQDNTYKVEEIRFSDGAIWTVADVIAHAHSNRMTEGNDFGVIGFRWNDVINALGGNDLVSGMLGDDRIDGGAGDDTLYGNAGADTLIGGIGNDALYGDSSTGTGTGDGNDDLDGGAGADSLYGAGGSDILQGGSGNDVLDGGDGNDTFLIDRTSGFDNIGDSAGTDRIVLAAGIVPANVGLFRDGFELVLTLDQSVSQTRIFGQYGGSTTPIDRVEFADGTVWDAPAILSRTVTGTPNAMTGTAANDSFVVDDAGDTITEGLNQGTDTVTSSVSYTLPTNVENLTLTGVVNLRGTGNALNNVLTGNSGNNVLDGGVGADTLIGGAGDDTYLIYSPEGDIVTEAANAGIDTIISEWDYTLPNNVENLTASNKYFRAISLTGNAQDNVITVSNNWGGNVLNGGAGADTMICLTFNATFYVDNPGDVVIGSEANVVTNQDWTLADGWHNVKLLTGASHAVGNSINNVMTGNGQNDLLEGLGGNDTFLADIGTDYYSLGVDTLAGGMGNDTYSIDWTSASHDVVVELAGEGDDTVVIYGLVRTYATDEFANVENLTLKSSSGASGLVGNAGTNRLVGNDSDNLIIGGEGDDYLVDGDPAAFFFNGNDTLSGGAGDDSLISTYGTDILDGGAGTDTLSTSTNSQSTVIFGRGYGADLVYATGTSVSRHVRFNADTQAGDLVLVRNGTDMQMAIGAGADVLTWKGFFADAISTQPSGTLSFVEFADGLQLSASNLVALLNSSGLPTANADVLLGTGGADSMVGLAGDDLLISGDGNDLLRGDSGNDTVVGGAGSDIYRFGRGDGQDLVIDASGTADGLLFDNGIAPADVSVRQSGTDLLLTIIGTTDQVTIKSFLAGPAQQLDRVEFANGTVWDVPTLVDLSSRIDGTAAGEYLGGTSNADRIFGYAGDDTLQGLDGDDTLDAGDGNDSLFGDAGADTMIGGLGNDQYFSIEASDVIVEVAGGGFDTVYSLNTYALVAPNVEALVLNTTANVDGTGNSENNTITGGDGLNRLDGGAGDDVLLGGLGNDTLIGGIGNDSLDGGTGNDSMAGGVGDDNYVVNVSTDVVTELASEGVDAVKAGVTYTLGLNVENLTLTGTGVFSATGNTLDNVLTGNGSNNTLTGLAGNDTLDGGLGNDTMVGGVGNDTYVVNVTTDVVTEVANEGTDTVLSAVTLTLATNLENLTLTGTANINATGNTVANVLTGNAGNNAINGGTGADTMIGGAGNDTYTVDNTLDVITELAGEGTDAVSSGVSYTLSANVENLTLTGTGTFTAAGNALDNLLIGNSGNNTLSGLAGNDTLDGGTGNDTMLGGAGNDTYVVNIATDVVTELANEGIDTINASLTWTIASAVNVENVTLAGTGTFNATGNGLDNVLVGNSANNTLTGNGGNDTLDGGLGNDAMVGGAGNDTYVVNVATDVMTELVNEGTDTVLSAVTLTLGATSNLENLTLTGTSALNATGNTLNNVLTGNAGANVLAGAAGDDTYNGAAGNDTCSDTSTTSNDTYLWGAGSGLDTLTDSGGALDHVDLFAGITAAQLKFTRNVNNLELSILGNAADKLTINGWYTSSANQIEEFRLADGSKVLAGQVNSLLSAMATFDAGASSGLAGARMSIQPVRPGVELVMPWAA